MYCFLALCLTLLSLRSHGLYSSGILQATPCPIPSVEIGIKTKMRDRCATETELRIPNISWVDWIYENKTIHLDSSYAQIRKKSSTKIDSWKKHLKNVFFLKGYDENKPHIGNKMFFHENLKQHISLNGVVECRDIYVVIDELDDNHNPYCVALKQLDVLEIVLITNHFRIPQLNGQYAIRALRDIPKHTVIGRFCGDEMFAFEYNQIFIGTCEYLMRNHYRMSMECPQDKVNDIQCPFGFLDNKIVLDELGPFSANPMVIMNDVRKDITKRNITVDDKKYWNAEYFHIFINGWPLLYVVTTKPIYRGQEIASYYGPGYAL